MFLGLVQETSLAFYVGVTEIFSVAYNLSYTGLDYLEGYIMLTVIYEVLSLVISRGFRNIEAKAGKFRWRAETSTGQKAAAR
ncbi:MAG: hypothetical protein LBG27_11170 [Spirochaetaceae bacterium]|jgi:ABC-type amino acid transport system permease subunit|nr:hypothetical protein [Spirochaetaceae bacterium]